MITILISYSFAHIASRALVIYSKPRQAVSTGFVSSYALMYTGAVLASLGFGVASICAQVMRISACINAIHVLSLALTKSSADIFQVLVPHFFCTMDPTDTHSITYL